MAPRYDWPCPWVGCEFRLADPRVVVWGCLGLLQPLGDCPWHGPLVPQLTEEERAKVLREAAR